MATFPPPWLRLSAFDERSEWNSQLPGNSPQVQNGDIPFSPLHRTDESAVQATALAQFLLREALSFSFMADAQADLTEKFLFVKVHA